MLHRTEGIILKSTPFAEADLIVTILSLEYGLIRVFAKSSRKTTSRFGSSLEPLTYSRIAFWGKENKELPRLTQSDIIRNFQSLRDEMNCLLKLLKMIEFTLKVVPEREKNRNVFNLLLNTLIWIERYLIRQRSESRQETRDNYTNYLNTVSVFYTIRLLDLEGFGPRLNGCARCNRSGTNFYISHGAILCENCASTTDHIKLSPQIINVYETLRKWDISKLERIRLTGPIIRELMGIIDAHTRYTLSIGNSR